MIHLFLIITIHTRLYTSELSSSCPHPLLAFLASSQFPPLENLYVQVNAIPIATDKHQAVSSHDNTYLVPLKNHCIRELLLAQLHNFATVTPIEKLFTSEPSSSSVGSQFYCNSVDLLPDHAREQNIREISRFRHRYALIHGGNLIASTTSRGCSRYYVVQLSPEKEPLVSPRPPQVATSGTSSV